MPSRYAVNRRLMGVEACPRGLAYFHPGLQAWWIPKEMQMCE
jgi:hypothetical protein